MDKFLEKYWGHVVRNDGLPLQVRLYRLFCLVAGTTCLGIIMPVNLLQSLPLFVHLGNILLGLVGLGLYRASCRGRDHFLLFFLVIVVLLDAVWPLNAGSQGSLPYFFFPVLLLPLTVFRGKARWLLSAGLVANVCGLLAVEHFFPAVIVPFKSASDRMLDLGTGVFCSCLALALVVWVILSSYEAERDRIVRVGRELAESEKHYREVVENARSIILRVGRRGQVTFFNRFAEELFGWRRDEIIGHPVAERILPTAGPAGGRLDALMEQLLAHAETEGVCRDGRRIRVHWTCQPVYDARGDLDEILCVGADLTERVALLERLLLTQKTMDAAAEQIIWTDAGGRIIYANTAATEALDYSAAQMLGLTMPEITADLPTASWPEHWAAMKRDRALTLEAMEKRRDGSLIPVEIKLTYLNIGGREYATAFLRDITERRNAESRRRQVDQQMQHVQKMEGLGLLAGGLAHDYNNILTGILGNISLAKMDLPPAGEDFKSLEQAELGAFRAKDLTAQLLAFSSGGQPVRSVMALEPVIRDSTSGALQGSAIDCAFHMPADLWPVNADATQFAQVIGNLVTNARQAMAGAGRITIEAKNLRMPRHDTSPPTGGKSVQLTVTDPGAGIAREHLAKIFDPYFTTKKSGRGLGLAVAYSIIKNHDGQISVQSQVGAGTTFTIRLPAAEPATASTPPMAIDSVSRALQVLIMDDEEMVRRPLGRMMEKMGYQVTATSDGAEALDAYHRAKTQGAPIDLLIMDLTIPGGMDGKEAIRRLREIDPRVKAIVSSGYSQDPIMANFRAYGFHGVMPKPYTIEQLKTVLHEVMQAEEPAVGS